MIRQSVRRWTVVALMIAVSACSAGCAGSASSADSMVQAPVLVGISLREAEQKAAAAGVAAQVTSSEPSDTLPVDFVKGIQ